MLDPTIASAIAELAADLSQLARKLARLQAAVAAQLPPPREPVDDEVDVPLYDPIGNARRAAELLQLAVDQNPEVLGAMRITLDCMQERRDHAQG